MDMLKSRSWMILDQSGCRGSDECLRRCKTLDWTKCIHSFILHNFPNFPNKFYRTVPIGKLLIRVHYTATLLRVSLHIHNLVTNLYQSRQNNSGAQGSKKLHSSTWSWGDLAFYVHGNPPLLTLPARSRKKSGEAGKGGEQGELTTSPSLNK